MTMIERRQLAMAIVQDLGRIRHLVEGELEDSTSTTLCSGLIETSCKHMGFTSQDLKREVLEHRHKLRLSAEYLALKDDTDQ